MPLTFIVPGWHAAASAHPETFRPDASTAELPGFDAQGQPRHAAYVEQIDRRWHIERDAPPCWRTALWDSLAPAAPGEALTMIPAANDWADRAGRPAPAGPLLRADPVSLLADRDTAILHPSQSLALSEDDSDRLAASLNDFLIDDELSVHALTPTDWYLSGPNLPSLTGLSPDALAFESFDPMQAQALSQPSSSEEVAAQRRLRTLQSEIEMVLHTHPVNLERRARGLLQVSGLHAWGAAGDWPQPTRPRALPAPDFVAGSDAFVRAAARARDVPWVDERTSDSVSAAQAGQHAIVVDLSLLSPWLRSDARALDDARSAFIGRHLGPLAGIGASLAWRPRSATDPGSGVRIIAEAGWCHRVQAPPGGAASRMIGRLRGLVDRVIAR